MSAEPHTDRLGTVYLRFDLDFGASIWTAWTTPGSGNPGQAGTMRPGLPGRFRYGAER